MATKREERMKEITDRLQEGLQELFQSERYAEYLRVMSQFHKYSFNNTLLIAMQKPDATQVAGYHAWEKKFNRHVRKGEKGIQIIAPEAIREKREQEKIDPETGDVVLREDGQPEMEEVTVTTLRFRATTVFDISQTEGEPLPELSVNELAASVDDFDSYMEAIRNVAPVPIRFDEINGEARGYYDNINKEIVIQSDMGELQTVKTAIHETAHAVLHDLDIMQENGIHKDQVTRECEAESVAFTVLSYFGLDTSDYSFPYIAGWSNDKDMKVLRASMDTIRKTAGEMIEGMSEVLRQRAMEREEIFQMVDLFGTPALFSNKRLEMPLMPEGLYRYELRGADYDPALPVSLENDVQGNHAGTILTAFRVELPDEGRLWLGDGLNFMEGEQTIEEYRHAAGSRNKEALAERMQSEIGRANELLYLSNDQDRYIFYQVSVISTEMDDLFGDLDLAGNHGLSVKAENYVYGYSGLLKEEEALESFESRINRTVNTRADDGNNLLIGDVLVMKRSGEAKAYYVDAKGWTELPDFVEQRRQVAELSNKIWYAPVTMETTGVELEQHEGLWHPVERRIVQDEIFYLMVHNEYGDSVNSVIVNSDGVLIAQELEHGFDRGAMEAVREYLEEKGIVWEPDEEELKQWGIGSEEYITERGEEDVKKPFIARYYVVNDAYGVKAEREYQYFEKIEDAISAYHTLPNHLDKQLGMESSEQPPSQMTLIHCQNGLEKMNDIKSASLSGKWRRSEVAAAYHEAENYLDMSSQEAAYELQNGKGYFFIQRTDEGWHDYTFYDKSYHERDGGAYDDETCSMEEAMKEILAEEHIRMESCKVINLEDFLDKVEEVERRDLWEKVDAFESDQQIPAMEVDNAPDSYTLTSESTEKEKALGGLSRAEIEETVLCYAQTQLDELGMEEEVKLLGARVYGSRRKEGLYKEDSDIDVALSYTGDMREDVFFNALHEHGMKMAGLPVDINPISLEQTGTLEEYLKQAETYLEEKAAEKIPEEDPEASQNLSLRYYVAECMEFPVLGEYHEADTLEEAMKLYEQIPAERMNGIKGIGFQLYDGNEWQGEFHVMSAGRVDTELIGLAENYRNSALIQQTLAEILEHYPDREESLHARRGAVEAEPMLPSNEKDIGSKKESVLKALRERQSKIKEQEKKSPEQKKQNRKKGEQSL